MHSLYIARYLRRETFSHLFLQLRKLSPLTLLLTLHKVNMMPSVLARVSVAVLEHHDQKQLGDERVDVSLSSQTQSITEGKSGQGRNLEAELRQRP